MPSPSASTSRRTPRTGSTSSGSTACGSTRRRPSTIDPRDTSSRRSGAGPARPRADARSSWWPKTRRRPCAWFVRSTTAATGWTRCGTTTFTTGHRRDHRKTRSVLLGPSRHAAGAHLGRQVRLPLSGTALRVAEAAARHPHRRPCRPRAFVTFSRTTIRSPTPAMARAFAFKRRRAATGR